ncbi:hypothetical protein JHD49_11535 [Sulfurimonas sp. SAG-AH-194-C21]|nr:hypothetical protein [Sulfurimonas sp. SAG-AH-194-C21]
MAYIETRGSLKMDNTTMTEDSTLFAYNGDNAFTLDSNNVEVTNSTISNYVNVTNVEYPKSIVWNRCTFQNISGDFRGGKGAAIPNSSYEWKDSTFDNVASFDNYNNYRIINNNPKYINTSNKLLEK